MNLSSIYPNAPSGHTAPQKGADADSEIRSLEQKLQTLEMEKQKAVQRKEEDRKEKLEKQIAEIEKQIQQLRNQEAEKTQSASSEDTTKVQKRSKETFPMGNYIDVYA